MSYTDYLNRKKINTPSIISTQIRLPDASSYTWRKKLGSTQIFNPTNHAITNVNDPGHSPNFHQKAVSSYKGTGFGGRVRDASTFTLSRSATSIGNDDFTRGRIQTVTTNASGKCLASTPASQIVNQNGNSNGSKAGLNMGYVTDCAAEFQPLTKSYFVDTHPDIKNNKVGYGRFPVRTGRGVVYPQNPILTTTTNTSGVAEGVSKAEVPHNLYSARPAKEDFLTAISGPQSGGGSYPGQRAAKTGGALRKILEVTGQHGFAGYAPTVPTRFVPPNNAPPHKTL
jgi:hypothetical protein